MRDFRGAEPAPEVEEEEQAQFNQEFLGTGHVGDVVVQTHEHDKGPDEAHGEEGGLAILGIEALNEKDGPEKRKIEGYAAQIGDDPLVHLA